MEVNGTMMLKINDPACTKVKLDILHHSSPSVQFKTHPNVDKALWSNQSAIALRDPSRPYPLAQPLGILRWRHASTQESDLPISGTFFLIQSTAGRRRPGMDPVMLISNMSSYPQPSSRISVFQSHIRTFI